MSSKPVPVAFEGFTRLSPVSYFLQPSPTDSTLSKPFRDGKTVSDVPPPDLVIFAAWLDASPKHTAKYVATYRRLYPKATIIIITHAITEDIFRSNANNHRWYDPIVAILSTLPAASRILLHTVSNGGASSMMYVAELLQERSGRALPISAHIIDSAPGEANFWVDLRAISTGFPKNPIVNFVGKAMLLILMVIYQVLGRITGTEHPITMLRNRLSRPDLFPTKAPRVYIYSKEDQMVGYKDVERHIAQARQDGWKATAEEFKGSQHVSHMPHDKERYWKIVQDTWASSFKHQRF